MDWLFLGTVLLWTSVEIFSLGISNWRLTDYFCLIDINYLFSERPFLQFYLRKLLFIDQNFIFVLIL